MKRFISAVLHLAPAPAYTAWLLSMGTMRVDGGSSINDKLAHAIGFGLLAVLVALALRYAWPALRPCPRAWVSFALATSVGAGLEMWQFFLPYRSAEWLDLVADAGGALVGGGLASVALARWGRQHEPGGVARDAAAADRDH